MSGGDERGALGRWSRLKQEAREREETPPAPAEEETAALPEDAADPTADLPDIDSLDAESDYTVFLRDGVPEALRNRALRKLWRSDPVLANLDGLNDYDEDFVAELKEGVAWMERMAAEEARKLQQQIVEAADPDAAEEGEAGAPATRPEDDPTGKA